MPDGRIESSPHIDERCGIRRHMPRISRQGRVTCVHGWEQLAVGTEILAAFDHGRPIGRLGDHPGRPEVVAVQLMEPGCIHFCNGLGT